jgi:hypothetical protein
MTDDDLFFAVVVGLGVLLLHQAAGEAFNVEPTLPQFSPLLPALPPVMTVQPPTVSTQLTQPGDGRSELTPIIAMPLSNLPAQVRASLAYYGRTDDEYWIDHEDHAGQFSNGLWYAGHNAYWFARMDPNNDGSADPFLAGQPAPF